MRMLSKRRIFFLLAMLCLSVTSARAAAVRSEDIFGAIRAAEEAGTLDPGHAALYRLWTVKAPEKLRTGSCDKLPRPTALYRRSRYGPYAARR